MIDFNELITNYVKREIKEKTPGRYYPSEAGNCIRKVYYSYKQPKEVGMELLKIFEAGNILHEFIVNVLESEKNPDIELIEKESPFQLKVDDMIISGRVDDIVILKINNKIYLVEVKSTKSLQYTREPSEMHLTQLQIYMHAKEIHRGIIIYLEKNTLQSKTFEVKYDEEHYNKIVLRLKDLDKHIKENKLPIPEARIKSKMTWMCRNCQYREECFNDTPKL
ncbi:MAG: Dna2/Cas4 domain-containing protein [Nanoarchaeota archaeon]|nr:Dna2/Cas4 domain-containing protein [Nanoarchaeota archaeon]